MDVVYPQEITYLQVFGIRKVWTAQASRARARLGSPQKDGRSGEATSSKRSQLTMYRATCQRKTEKDAALYLAKSLGMSISPKAFSAIYQYSSFIARGCQNSPQTTNPREPDAVIPTDIYEILAR